MPDYTPIHKPAQTISSTASAAVTGGQVVSVSGDNTVAASGANSPSAVGVAGHDAAIGAPVTIHPLVGGVHSLLTAGAVVAGDRLKTGAAGTVVPWVAGTDTADLKIAIALAGAASGAQVRALSIR